MLEKPDLRDEVIVACLRDAYDLPVVRVTFLPLGADLNTAVYRAAAEDGTVHFCKLRSGVFDETSVALPRFLCDQGVAQIIAPLSTNTGQLWVCLEPFVVVLYPFVEGRNGYEMQMSDRHWIELGSAIKRVHTVQVPAELTRRIGRETYSPQGRNTVTTFLARVEEGVHGGDAAALGLAALLRDKHDEIAGLVARAEQLAQVLESRSREYVLCHSDLHAGNVLIDGDGGFYIVDWDDPILAPKERDLMYPGGAQGFTGHTPQQEESLFFQGYGPTEVDPYALAYYRYERIVQDIAVYCEQLFLSDGGGADRMQSQRYLAANFRPDGTIEMAHRADAVLRGAQASEG